MRCEDLRRWFCLADYLDTDMSFFAAWCMFFCHVFHFCNVSSGFILLIITNMRPFPRSFCMDCQYATDIRRLPRSWESAKQNVHRCAKSAARPYSNPDFAPLEAVESALVWGADVRRPRVWARTRRKGCKIVGFEYSLDFFWLLFCVKTKK